MSYWNLCCEEGWNSLCKLRENKEEEDECKRQGMFGVEGHGESPWVTAGLSLFLTTIRKYL